MKNNLRALIITMFVLSSGWLFAQTPNYIYFVPLPETQIHNSFKILYASTGTTYHTVISIVPSVSNVKIYYDQWEDGYEMNIGAPVQASTWIFGDGITTNNGGYPDPVIAGQAIILQNNLVVPNSAAIIKADGGDKIACSKSLSCVRSSWSTNPGTVLADAVEFLNTQAYGTSYEMPIGENTVSGGMFNLVSMHVQASQNATQIQIIKDPAFPLVITTATINQGESYQINGGIKQGALVTSNKPVQVVLITGKPGAMYESRWYDIYPLGLWDKGYFTPVSTTVSTAESHVFIYNPTSSPLSVTVHTNTNLAGTVLTVPAKGTYRYVMPMGSSAHFDNPTTNFFAVGACDADATNTTWDWGYSLVPENYLTTSFFVGWGVGAYASSTQNGNPVWVGSSTITNTTTVYIDLDGNPGSGPLTDINGNKYNYTLSIPPMGSTRIYDNSDNDQTGIHCYTLDGTEIVGAWGEDASRAGAGTPFLDVGTTIAPDPVLRVWKTATIITDGNSNGLADIGDVIQWKIKVYNQTLQSYPFVILRDTLDSHLTYIAGTTTFDNAPIPDNVSPFTAFPLDEVGFDINPLSTGAKDSITFNTTFSGPILGITSVPNTIHAVNNFGETFVSNVKVPVNTAGVTACAIVYTATDNGTTVVSYNENATIYVKVTDGDQNVNAAAVDHVQVTVFDAGTADSEILTLNETGNNTGDFTAFLNTSNSLGTGANNGILYAVAGNSVQATYTDVFYGGTCQTTATIATPSLVKQLYLSDDIVATGLDRVLPPDGTTATYTLGGTTNTPNMGMFTRDDGANDGKYSIYSAGTFGADATALAQNNPEFYTDAKCPIRNEVFVAIQTNNAGLFLRKWDGTIWTDPPSPLLTPIVGAASISKTYRNAAISYENVSGEAVFVWRDSTQTNNNRLRYSVWNGTTWTSPASITGVNATATVPMYMAMASKPGANEILLVVAYKDGTKYGVVWNGTTNTWGNILTIVIDAAIDHTALATAYTSNGTGFVLYDAADAGPRADYHTWNGTVWSATTTINSGLTLAGAGNKWITLASNPSSNYLLAGLIVNGTPNNEWFTVWNGTTWGNFIGGTTAPNINRRTVSVATEKTSGRFIATYSTNVSNGTKYRVFTPPATWTTETTGPTSGAAVPQVQNLVSNPSNNNIMWMASNSSSNLYASEWNGTSWGTVANPVGSGGLLTPSKQPFTFWYGNSVSSITTVTFTMNPTMCSNFTMPSGGTVYIKLYLTNWSGLVNGSNNIAATLKNNGATVLSFSSGTFTDNAGTTNDILEFSGALIGAQTVTLGTALTLDITNNVSGASFDISYDAVSYPSRINLPTTSVISMGTLTINSSPNPSVSPITGATNGQTVYVRTTVTDPFGDYDIDPPLSTPALVITDPSAGTTNVTMTQVGTVTCGKIYEYAWNTPAAQGAYTLTATSKEGYENAISSSRSADFSLNFTDVGTPCNITFINQSTPGYVTVTSYTAPSQVCIEVNDMDRNTNSVSQQTITATIAVTGGDSETLILTETGNNTGKFTGCIAASATLGTGANNGTLLAPAGSALVGTFDDLVNAPDICTANAVILTPTTTIVKVTKNLVSPIGGYASVGDSVIWQIVVTNPGTGPLATVTLVDTWPTANLTYVTSSITPASTGISTITWNLGPMNSGTNKTILVKFLATVAPVTNPITNSVSVTGTASAGPATSSVNIVSAKLSILKTKTSPADPIYATISPVTQVIYNILITNSGTSIIESIPLIDNYSSTNLSFVSSNFTPSSSGGGQITWDDLIPGATQLAVGASLNVTVTFNVIAGNYPFPVSNNATTGFAAIDVNNKSIPTVSSGVDITIYNLPTAVNDFDTTLMDVPVSGNVLVNDISPDGFVLTVTTTPVSGPMVGASVVLNADGSFTYTPATGFVGNDTFTYQVCDTHAKCVTAVVAIHILACSTPPTRPNNVIKN